jgi:uncharacterized membrane protein YtjA (UPF0391 family)
MLLLWAIIFLISAIIFGSIAFGGIAIAISFFSKLFLIIALICLAISLALMLMASYRHGKKKQ